jgi:hypothetical protein
MRFAFSPPGRIARRHPRSAPSVRPLRQPLEDRYEKARYPTRLPPNPVASTIRGGVRALFRGPAYDAGLRLSFASPGNSNGSASIRVPSDHRHADSKTTTSVWAPKDTSCEGGRASQA